MLLENMSYPEVEVYLKEKDVLLVPVGSVEQHSPYGLIGTDAICAEAVAREVGRRLAVMVAPTLSYGVSSHHMAFAGTLSISPATAIAMVQDLIRSSVTHGFRRIIFINGHGGNITPLQTAFKQLKMDHLPGCFEVISWYADEAVRKSSGKAFGDQEGQHATPSEVSLTRHLRPDAFDGKAVSPGRLERPKYYWPLSATEMRQVFPDGRMESAPWLASAEMGKKLLDKAVESLQRKVEKIMQLDIL
jgi:creatinine amidohydrolase